ncbi:MAG TPA: hypothetical protein VM368_04190 [Flavisolibacter sp.]|nr:hypothetical protein [Flavisolibacter sp.]
MNATRTILNEQEAAIAILLSCLHYQDRAPNKRSLSRLSYNLQQSSKFYGYSLPDIAADVMPLVNTLNQENVLQQCSVLISDNFRETLFAMVCEIITIDGEMSESDGEIIGLAALYLGISIELMRVMITTFLIRNKWNA